ncbi:LacI family DNA-binding transcriptional regulator [Sphingomonas sp. HITSZ_GF]|uniref:LacI family DNA-binding transcriptional regulator n=1 Tax=Sphingomonas sp. HITSZ_GF TaxID=3037247 RepID=UPI00240DFC8C|nr:LacI family DNA-binding transcriptional regulator [Sphingomonas sp. HITSZ_GF]MDG2535859.1 LacI family DNA-binding transcriptional regulator [Sphingomonas sp. HITSZ_GF]
MHVSSRPTIKEVSKIAGVSFKTVSRVLNNEKHVSEETRRRVEEVVARLNFRPSHAARTLAGRKSFQIGLLYDNPSPYYIFHVQSGAQQRCTEQGYRLLVQPIDSQAPDLVSNVLALIDETHLDGLILSPPVTEATALLDELDKRGLPYVRIAPGVRREAGLAATMDDVAAARELVEHLVGLGHRRIAFISGPESHISSSERLRGYRAALEGAGIAFDPALVVPGDYSFDSGYAAAQQLLLGKGARPTAIFAGNDDMAAGALAVAHENDIEVPGALSIAGFDDSDLARAVWPPLTTIHQPVYDLAAAAAELILGTPPQPRVTLEHKLMVRASTGPAPK